VTSKSEWSAKTPRGYWESMRLTIVKFYMLVLQTSMRERETDAQLRGHQISMTKFVRLSFAMKTTQFLYTSQIPTTCTSKSPSQITLTPTASNPLESSPLIFGGSNSTYALERVIGHSRITRGLCGTAGSE
jgi:hypothetical protein